MNTFYAQHRAVARIWAALTMFAILLSAISAPLSAFAQENPTPDAPLEGQVAALVAELPITLCHSTDSETNAFTKVTINVNGLSGHGNDPEDIIPVVLPDYPNGQNLDTLYGDVDGAAILANDCEVPAPAKEAKISITKIVCENEASLPNGSYAEITASTAADFLAANPTCAPENKVKFQWAEGGQSNGSSPDNSGELGSPWETTGYTNEEGKVVITLAEKDVKNNPTISVREVWSDDYIPFSGNGGSNVTAEIYCADDAAGFDNLEWIPGVQVDNTYHCVAWNVLEVPDPVTCELVVKSDDKDLVVEKNAYAKVLSTIHNNWVNSIPASLAKWIWGDNPVALPTTAAETQTFKKSFTWNGLTVESAVLTLASDNSHAVTLGSFSAGNPGEFNYGATTTYNVATSAIAIGTNTLTVEVENFALANSDASSNPAGLIYELKIKGTGTTADCGVVVPLEPVVPKFSDVTMCKYGPNENALSGWNLMLLGEKVADVKVSATSSTGTTVNLNPGSYVAIASGTWDNNRGPLNIVDAEYSTEDNWVTQMDGFDGYGTDILELQLNGAFDPNSDWGEYNSAHKYARGFTQTATGTATFAIYDTYYTDNTGSLDVSVVNGYAGVTGENGCVTFKDVPYGMYSVDEIMKDGWKNVYGLGEVKVDSKTERFEVINKIDENPVEKKATVVAHKIVCTDEADLPNWGAVEGNVITATTAATWVAEHDSCRLEKGWDFQWATSSAANPDNNLPASGLYGYAGGWNTFGSTEVNGSASVELRASDIAGMSHIWVREVLKDGYIPFTYGPNNTTNEDDYSAEMYCHTDVFNYDNYDRVDGIEVGNTYHCVAWNHAEKTAPICDASKNLLENASFEAPVVTNEADWDIFSLSAYPALAWAVEWVTGGEGAPKEASLELHAGVNGWTSASGAQHAELDSDWQGPAGTSGENASVAISQEVPTIAGKDYVLSWSFSPRPNTSEYQNVLEVLVDGIVKRTNSTAGGSDTNWTTDSYTFTGTGASTTITFQDAGMGNSEGTFLDNVSLNCREPENGGGDNGDGGEGDGDPDPTPTPTSNRGGGGGGQVLLRTPAPTETVAGITDSTIGAGGDFVTPEGQVLGDQVSAVPYGAPGTGHGGSAATSGLTLLQLLFAQRRKELV